MRFCGLLNVIVFRCFHNDILSPFFWDIDIMSDTLTSRHSHKLHLSHATTCISCPTFVKKFICNQRSSQSHIRWIAFLTLPTFPSYFLWNRTLSQSSFTCPRNGVLFEYQTRGLTYIHVYSNVCHFLCDLLLWILSYQHTSMLSANNNIAIEYVRNFVMRPMPQVRYDATWHCL